MPAVSAVGDAGSTRGHAFVVPALVGAELVESPAGPVATIAALSVTVMLKTPMPTAVPMVAAAAFNSRPFALTRRGR